MLRLCVGARTRIHTRVYNDTTKAVPHVSHYDFSALLLIKMQIYRDGGASGRASERARERSGGKTDYVWGRHDKHRNMINSTQPHPGTPTRHRRYRARPSARCFPPPPLPSRCLSCSIATPLNRRISFFPTDITAARRPSFLLPFSSSCVRCDLFDQFPPWTTTTAAAAAAAFSICLLAFPSRFPLSLFFSFSFSFPSPCQHEVYFSQCKYAEDDNETRGNRVRHY